MAGGPQPTTLAGRSPRSSRRASRSVTKPWCPADAVVGRHLDGDPRRAEVVDAGQQRGRPYAIEQWWPTWRGTLTVGARDRHAELPAAQGQERRLADPAGHEDDRAVGGRAEAVAQRPPDRESFSRSAPGQRGGPSPDHEIDDVEGDRGSRTRRGPRRTGPAAAQQRVARPLAPGRIIDELTGPDRPGDRGIRQPQPVRVPSDRQVLQDRHQRDGRGPVVRVGASRLIPVDLPTHSCHPYCSSSLAVRRASRPSVGQGEAPGRSSGGRGLRAVGRFRPAGTADGRGRRPCQADDPPPRRGLVGRLRSRGLLDRPRRRPLRLRSGAARRLGPALRTPRAVGDWRARPRASGWRPAGHASDRRQAVDRPCPGRRSRVNISRTVARRMGPGPRRTAGRPPPGRGPAGGRSRVTSAARWRGEWTPGRGGPAGHRLGR